MLLIDPPSECLTQETTPYARVRFQQFLKRYENAVLDLPFSTLNNVLRYLTRGFRGEPMTPAILHQVVERELQDDEAEPSGKVARLIILTAFGRSLEDLGLDVMESTRLLLAACERKVPAFLRMAIDDHLGIVPANNS